MTSLRPENRTLPDSDEQAITRIGQLRSSTQPYATAAERRRLSPNAYLHLKLAVDGDVATLALNVQEDAALMGIYPLKLNSSDLGVEHEIYDGLNRILFEHPSVRVVVLASDKSNIFSAGANIPMLRESRASILTGFVRYSNVTRCCIEEITRRCGIGFIAAIRGSAAGAGYELALAAETIALVNDRWSAVSLPELPLLGVIPASGGLTRLIDKRMVRRDIADLFCSRAEGMRGQRALSSRLVDVIFPPSSFDRDVARLASDRARRTETSNRAESPIAWSPLSPVVQGNRIMYRYVTLTLDTDHRRAEIFLRGPETSSPRRFEGILEQGDSFYYIALFRELEDAIMRLEFDQTEIGLILIHPSGSFESLLEYDQMLENYQHTRIVKSIQVLISTILKRIDYSPKSYFTLLREDDCPAGPVLEVALACDRIYALPGSRILLTAANWGAFPMGSGWSRLATRYLGGPMHIEELRSRRGPLCEEEDLTAIVTAVVDPLDWDTDVRHAIEERTSFSPDALCAMEASLRFPGPETLETKIFGRLSAWQTFIFARQSVRGHEATLNHHGPEKRPLFWWDRP
jgi:benzoyl-CoA-dihydrodiol lyase